MSLPTTTRNSQSCEQKEMEPLLTARVGEGLAPLPEQITLPPFLYSISQMDLLVNVILKKYYPKALKRPMALLTDKLLEHMGFIRVYEVVPDNVFGRAYFSDATVISWDGHIIEAGYEPAAAESVEKRFIAKDTYRELRERMDSEDPRSHRLLKLRYLSAIL